MTRIAILAAAGITLMATTELPLFPSAPFLKYDAGDVPVLIAAFTLGPVMGVGVAFVKSFIHLSLHGTPEAFIGAPMNFLAGASFAWCAGSIYALKKTKTRAILSLIGGGLFATVVMVGANLLVLPAFVRWFAPGGPSLSFRLLMTVIVPFNLIKVSINGVLFFLVCKRISPIFKTSAIA